MPDTQSTITNGQAVSLYQHFTALLAEQEKLVNKDVSAIREVVATQHAATEQAVKLASEAITKRLEVGNEVRGALDDMSRQMARRSELETAITTLRAEIKATLGTLEADVRNLRESMLTTATKAELRPLEDYRVALDAKATNESVGKVAKTAEDARRSSDFGRTLAIIGTAVSVISLGISVAVRLAGG